MLVAIPRPPYSPLPSHLPTAPPTSCLNTYLLAGSCNKQPNPTCIIFLSSVYLGLPPSLSPLPPADSSLPPFEITYSFPPSWRARTPTPRCLDIFDIYYLLLGLPPPVYPPPCPPDTAPRSAAGKTPARISEPVVYSRNSACVPLTPSISPSLSHLSARTIFVYVSVLLSPIDDLIQDKKYLPALQCMLFFDMSTLFLVRY